MGSGKSTIGRQLARMLKLDFEDTDHEIQNRTGVDIPTIFDFEGEAGFRHREKQVIDELTQRDGLVLATGGGAVMDPDNRRNLSSRGLVIYLNCKPEQQYERTVKDKNRPLLQTEDRLARLTTLMQERDPLYRAIADLMIRTDKRNANAIAKEIMRILDREYQA